MRFRKEEVRPVGRAFAGRRLMVALATLFAAVTAIGMTVAPAAAAASPARDVTQAITHNSIAYIHASVKLTRLQRRALRPLRPALLSTAVIRFKVTTPGLLPECSRIWRAQQR